MEDLAGADRLRGQTQAGSIKVADLEEVVGPCRPKIVEEVARTPLEEAEDRLGDKTGFFGACQKYDSLVALWRNLWELGDKPITEKDISLKMAKLEREIAESPHDDYNNYGKRQSLSQLRCIKRNFAQISGGDAEISTADIDEATKEAQVKAVVQFVQGDFAGDRDAADKLSGVIRDRLHFEENFEENTEFVNKINSRLAASGSSLRVSVDGLECEHIGGGPMSLMNGTNYYRFLNIHDPTKPEWEGKSIKLLIQSDRVY